MNKMIKGYYLALLISLGLLLVACNPAATPAEVGDTSADTANTAEAVDTDEQDVVAVSESPRSAADEESAASIESNAISLSSDGSSSDGSTASSNSTTVAGGETYKGLPVGFTDDGHAYIGLLDAPITIEEFSDFQCPFCERFHTSTLTQLLEGPVANGDAVLIFYDFPLDFHVQAIPAAIAARCAGQNGAAAYWAMHDALFENMNVWGVSNPNPALINLASQIGLDAEAFAICLDDAEGKNRAIVDSDIAFGRSRGVTGTPTFFLNDQILVGAQPFSTFSTAVDRLLNGEQIAAVPSDEELDIPPFQMPEPVVLADDYVVRYGSEDAPILIVEFTDYQCPFCARHSAQTMPVIIREMVDTGRAQYAIKDFPLDSIHPLARAASVAARCAGEQDQYTAMHDALFNQQALWGQSADPSTQFISIATALDLNVTDFETCLTDGRYDESVQSHLDEGLAQGINGTPAFFIGGYFVSGAQPFEVFELVVSSIEDGSIESLFRDAYDQQVAAYKAQLAQQQPPPPPAEPVDVPLGTAVSIGDPEAPIVIVEYTDFQCPYCGRHFAQTFPLLKEQYIDTGVVRYVFKDFPLDFHPQAGLAAQAARCSHEQDRFLDMHGLLFERQGEWGGRNDAIDIFVGYAADLDMEEAPFRECLYSGRYEDAVQADFEEGATLGVTGTPSFFVNGNPLVGAIPYSIFEQTIEVLMSEQ